jgi:glycosyltransferase involved in cell wall biosynthesis
MLSRGFNACAIVPVYNHEAPVVRVAHRLRSLGLPVILVDDGSSSSCAAILDQLATESGITLKRHVHNAGKGGAVKTGLACAAELGFTHALQVDADGQHDLDDVPRLLAAAQAAPTAMICGQPIFDASIPKLRKLSRYLTHGLVAINSMSGKMYDAMCGYRVYPVDAMSRIVTEERTGNRMDFDPEILVYWSWRKLPVETVDTRVRYPEDGQSHFRLVLDNWFITRMHIRLFLRMLWRLSGLSREPHTGARQ